MKTKISLLSLTIMAGLVIGLSNQVYSVEGTVQQSISVPSSSPSAQENSPTFDALEAFQRQINAILNLLQNLPESDRKSFEDVVKKLRHNINLQIKVNSLTDRILSLKTIVTTLEKAENKTEEQVRSLTQNQASLKQDEEARVAALSELSSSIPERTKALNAARNVLNKLQNQYDLNPEKSTDSKALQAQENVVNAQQDVLILQREAQWQDNAILSTDKQYFSQDGTLLLRDQKKKSLEQKTLSAKETLLKKDQSLKAKDISDMSSAGGSAPKKHHKHKHHKHTHHKHTHHKHTHHKHTQMHAKHNDHDVKH